MVASESESESVSESASASESAMVVASVSGLTASPPSFSRCILSSQRLPSGHPL